MQIGRSPLVTQDCWGLRDLHLKSPARAREIGSDSAFVRYEVLWTCSIVTNIFSYRRWRGCTLSAIIVAYSSAPRRAEAGDESIDGTKAQFSDSRSQHARPPARSEHGSGPFSRSAPVT